MSHKCWGGKETRVKFAKRWTALPTESLSLLSARGLSTLKSLVGFHLGTWPLRIIPQLSLKKKPDI